ncbi:hypothetical protein BABINDRAFT_33828 [Babjeviella inositovora NRRL Y-12698]|uniref:AB hydrolase-1 domain-containing protein n=1 Tax=Babjeviella inositovora NRRL Y-12698 TaxID=984486 RepID=A0A1E3QU59_9ASCO|nr:uncharacterized protein BABINDRAFT_33828 [Babjeviella inositovora NRRL Y-12698]ODQ81223.1 hypothetical protein BABINDRAFT_33828 [Babjeviella inositovora NRRL Y-12698]
MLRFSRHFGTSLRSLANPSRVARASTSHPVPSNPQMAFPCLDRIEKKNALLQLKPAANSMESGPEPSYSRIQSGYKTFHLKEPIFLDYGGYLPEFKIAYESWGTLNAAKDNMILVHTGLSASSHAKSQEANPAPGWWENFIGAGKYLDTDKYFIVCTNAIGGCYGSTGPSSFDPADGERYATRFPILSINDMVRAQHCMVTEEFGVAKLFASIGASMGGMQSLAYASEFPEAVGKVVSISGCARSHPYSIAMRHCQRQVLMADANWNRGFYYDGVPPHVGMKLAREIATITYRSGPEWELRFGRNRADNSQSPALCPDFLVETYLDHQGEKFSLEYDANSLLYGSKAMDLFDLGIKNRSRALKKRTETESQNLGQGQTGVCALPSQPYQEKHQATETPEESLNDLVQGLKPISHKQILVIGVESDILFPVWQQREIAEVLRKGGDGRGIEYHELTNEDSMYGHDSFLLALDDIGGPVRRFLEKASVE